MSEWAIDSNLCSPVAERALLGWLWFNRPERRQVTDVLGSDDLTPGPHRALFDVLATTSGPLERVELASLAGVPLELVTRCQQDAPIFIASVVRVVAECSMRRRLRDAGAGINHAAKDLHTDAGTVLDESRQILERVELPGVMPEPPEDIASFVAREDPAASWVVPNVIEVGDRVIITAGEGVGKSTFKRQFVVMSAAGIHPFRRVVMDPVPCLLVDLESREAMVRRKMADLLGRARKFAPDFDPTNLRIACKPSGIDLTKRSGRAWLSGVIESTKPRIVAFGPLYKSYVGDMREEESARVVSGVIDDFAERYGCAWLIETHAPHGDGHGKRPLRPFGSSLWLRWPEMGVGLRAEGDSVAVEYWRYPRDERAWPAKFRKGGDWPWSAVWMEAA